MQTPEPTVSGRTRLVHALPAGVVDAGFASLSTFAVGLVAARFLEPTSLGAYALFFYAFVMVAVVVTQLLLVPAEIASLGRMPSQRLGLLRRTLGMGAIASLSVAPLTLITLLFLERGFHTRDVLALAVTAVVLTFVSPLQDHVRRLLHLGGRSWSAALTSCVQFLACCSFLGLLMSTRLPFEWVPLGSLALANVVSITLGSALAARGGWHSWEALSVTSLFASGKWLLVVGATPAIAGFITGGIVVQLAGSEALGFAEAARVVSQPLIVTSMGLSAVLAPRSMEAASHRDQASARRISRIFLTVMILATAIFLALFGHSWRWNLMAWMVPEAYTITGLVAATVVANLLLALVGPYRAELVGARLERSLGWDELRVNALQVASATLAGLTGAFAKPVALLLSGLGRWVAYRSRIRTLYQVGTDT